MDVKKILEEHKTEIKERFSVKSIGVFGSYARDEHKESSDVDILVEFEETTFDNFMDLLFFLEELFGKKVDLVTTGGLSSHIGPHIRREVVWCG